MLLGLYRMATELGSPLLAYHLRLRVRRGKEHAIRLGERSGRTTLPRPAGPLLWVHAASVGESLAALPLIEACLDERPRLHALVTTGTMTSARLMATRLPPRAFHQFAPIDRRAPGAVFPSLATGARLLDRIRDLAASDSGGGACAPAARLDQRSRVGALRRRVGIGPAASPDACLAPSPFASHASQADADRLSDLGALDVRRLGDLKHATPPLPAAPAALAELKADIGARPVWLAASTHPGEEAEILAAHRTLRQKHPGLLTVIVPRHRSAAMFWPRSFAPAAKRSRDGARAIDPILRSGSISPTRWASSAFSTAWPAWLSSAGLWCPMAGRTRWRRRGSAAPRYSARIPVISTR